MRYEVFIADPKYYNHLNFTTNNLYDALRACVYSYNGKEVEVIMEDESISFKTPKHYVYARLKSISEEKNTSTQYQVLLPGPADSEPTVFLATSLFQAIKTVVNSSKGKKLRVISQSECINFIIAKSNSTIYDPIYAQIKEVTEDKSNNTPSPERPNTPTNTSEYILYVFNDEGDLSRTIALIAPNNMSEREIANRAYLHYLEHDYYKDSPKDFEALTDTARKQGWTIAQNPEEIFSLYMREWASGSAAGCKIARKEMDYLLDLSN